MREYDLTLIKHNWNVTLSFTLCSSFVLGSPADYVLCAHLYQDRGQILMGGRLH